MVLSAITDITEQKRAAATIRRANRELRHKNEEMEQFVYTVSHDLKSPLVTITGFVGMLREDLAEENRSGVLDAVDRIEHATRHMSALIEDLLQLSRVGTVTGTASAVDVYQVVRSIHERLAARIREVGATIEIDENMPSIRADRMRLVQLFENLITNAIKYGCDRPNPRIEIGAITVNDEVRFFVRDNGQGIAPEYHQKIFEMFQRLHSDQAGTGIGLAIVARIAQAHGARVWVESEPGNGATFWIGWLSSKDGLTDSFQSRIRQDG